MGADDRAIVRAASAASKAADYLLAFLPDANGRATPWHDHNELTALNVKQALALQSLLAAQHRAETVARARDLATEEEAKQRFKTFVGNGKAYPASR